ncbi:ribokinase-like isoform X2 [Homalodisca vitripennis]|uniref:ribokinase-like isoform X2 n=1 Tax=Homalodisca vitripennis TaxID=197043 RepID=UPI001EECC2E9|nr:ribokinase-like isoform X2 [Homalodisca vitripennis]
MAKIVVVGSCMIDLTCFSPRLPKCGETIHGTCFQRDFGGKGANQCIAATRLGAETALVACLGDDIFGKEYLGHLRKNNVDTKHVSLIEGESCGIAQISVADSGDNHIIIVAGANNRLSAQEITNASGLLSTAEVVVFQFETPLTTTVKALKYCKQNNPAEIIQAQMMTGLPTETKIQCEVALAHLLDLGCASVIITLGKDGAMFASCEHRAVQYEPGTPVASPVDTTGAGDAFLGALAFLLAYRSEWPLKRKVQVSCSVAARSIMKRGTQSSFPYAKDLPPAWLSD